MATLFRDAPAVEEVAGVLIRAHHGHLRDSKIRYLFRVGDWSKGGKECWSGTTLLSGATAHVAADVDAIVMVNAEVWEALREDQREALVDHELSHLEPNASDAGNIVTNPVTGRPMLRTVAHDVEEFAAVIERHGLWRPDLEMAGEAIRARQVSMFSAGDDESEDAPGRLDGGHEGAHVTDVTLTGPDGRTVRTNVRELRRLADEVAGRERGKRADPVEA